MSDHAAKRPRIAMVVTRDISTDTGRARTIREIERALARNFEVKTFRLRSVFETRRVSDIGAAIWAWCKSVALGGSLPLQCALYAAPSEHRRLVEEISSGEFDAVYLDMVRCQLLLRRLRRKLPQTRIVTDFDDLISRRMNALVQLNQPLLTGFAGAFLPRWLRKLVEGPLSRLVTRYEGATIGSAEAEMTANSDAVVLVSSSERAHLLKAAPLAVASVHTVPPPSEVRAYATESSQHRRFVFVGSDSLLQNRLAIDFLLDLWRRLRPRTELHIYGRQERAGQEVAGVKWRGFVSDISEAYGQGSISLVPGLLPGGIKTKVIEAWSYGCPVLGNACAFEGLNVSGYPLSRSEEAWDSYILHPEDHAELWASAARLGNVFVRDTLSREHYAGMWRQIVLPKTHRAPPAQAGLQPIGAAQAV
jgi:glycosyltransferase involved in cell wall biosynthesis